MPYEKNPRNNEEAIEKVASSIEEFGFKQPIVIDAAGVIVVGHTRYLAAKQLGFETVPCVMADDLDPYQIKAYRLADNKVAEFSNWDFSLLETELEDLTESGFDVDNVDLNIDDLFEEDNQESSETFQVSLKFPIEYEVQVNSLIDKLGKDGLANLIIQEAISNQ